MHKGLNMSEHGWYSKADLERAPYYYSDDDIDGDEDDVNASGDMDACIPCQHGVCMADHRLEALRVYVGV